MKKVILSLLLIAIVLNLNAQQYVWQQLISIPSNPRHIPVGFEVNGSIYFGMGQSNGFASFNDLWNFDPNTNTWSQKATLPGNPRVGAASFSINGFGYVCCGWYNTQVQNPMNETWKYDPNLNIWNQVANFPGSARYTPSSFVINGIAYVGMGYAPYKNDFYAYNPNSNSWTPIANCPISGQSCAAFSLYGKGYIVAGNNSSLLSGVYQYDPVINIWTAKNNFPITTAGAFSGVVNDIAYVGLGIDQLSPSIHVSQLVYAYQPFLDYWSLVSTFPSFGRSSSIFVTQGTSGYLFGGNNQTGGSINPTAELWKFTPNVTSINESHLSEASIFYNNYDKMIFVNTASQSLNSFRLYSINGSLIYQKALIQGLNKFSLTEINLSNGIYMCVLFNETGGVVKSAKIVI